MLRGARMRMARKPSAIARELLRNFPKGGKRRNKRGKKRTKRNGENGGAPNGEVAAGEKTEAAEVEAGGEKTVGQEGNGGDAPVTEDAAAEPKDEKKSKPKKRSRRRKKAAPKSEAEADLPGAEADAVPAGDNDDEVAAVVDAVGDS